MSTPGLDALRAKAAFICDMDGVIYHGNQLLPGADGFVAEIETVLVLTGVTQLADLPRFAYRPRHVLPGIGAIVPGA